MDTADAVGTAETGLQDAKDALVDLQAEDDADKRY